MFDFDLSDMPENPDSIGSGGQRATPGRGMGIITGWEEYGGASGKAHKLTVELAAWSTPADVGKVHEENIFHADTTGKGYPKRRMLSLAMAAGLTSPAEYQRAQAEGKALRLDLQQLVGRPIMLELVEEPDQKDPSKKYIRVANIGLGWHHPADPKVAAWPKDLQRLQRMGITAATTQAAVPQAKQMTRPPAPAAPVPSNDDADPFGNVPF
jgi:hypothetical protein